MFELLHVADLAAYQAAEGSYAPRGYEADGFIHCCFPSQLSGVLERWFAEENRLLLLTLDGQQLGEDLRAEPGPGGQVFPHLYGRIPRSAILAATALTRDESGLWALPTLLPGRLMPTAEEMARAFHSTYAKLAPQYGLQILPGHDSFDALGPTLRELLVETMRRVRAKMTGWEER